MPGGVDLHRYYAAVDGPLGSDGTYPFKSEGQPDNCGIFNASQGGCTNNNLDQSGSSSPDIVRLGAAGLFEVVLRVNEHWAAIETCIQ